MLPNPLHNADQRDSESLAMRLAQAPVVQRQKAQLGERYLNAALRAQGSVSDQDMSLLDNAVAEYAFNAAQIVSNNDPYRPKITQNIMPPHEWFGMRVPGGRYVWDNPDTIYRIIPMNGASKYVIRGHVNPLFPTDINFTLVKDVNRLGPLGNIDINGFKKEPDGSFTVTVDSDPANGRSNHLQSTSEAVQLFMRETALDWAKESPASLTVERVDGPPAPAARTEEEMAREVADLMAHAMDHRADFLQRVLSTPPNSLAAPPPADPAGSALVTQLRSIGNFHLEDETVAVVKINPGGAKYFIFPVTDLWMVTADFQTHTSSLNNAQAVADSDGTYTLVLSLRDPGYHNWIDPVGLGKGTLFVRWQVLPNKLPQSGGPSISIKVVSMSELKNAVPTGMKKITPQERLVQIAKRAAGYSRRFAPVL